MDIVAWMAEQDADLACHIDDYMHSREYQEDNMQVSITYIEGEIIHTDENPYCEDETCPCQEAKRVAIAFAEEARKAAALTDGIKRDMRRRHQ